MIACVAWGKFLVHMSASWRVVDTLSGRMCPCFFQSWTAKCWQEICLLALHFALLFAHFRAAELSTIIGVGCRIFRPMDANNLRTKRASRALLFSATISASAELSAIDFWRADDHNTAAPCMTVTRPLVLCLVSRHPAQSESEKVMTGWDLLV